MRRSFFGIRVPKAYPRKIKKAIKGFWSIQQSKDGVLDVYFKVSAKKTKWQRKAAGFVKFKEGRLLLPRPDGSFMGIEYKKEGGAE